MKTLLIPLDCPNCAIPLLIPAQFAGQRGRCQHCGAALVVPTEVQPIAATQPNAADPTPPVIPAQAGIQAKSQRSLLRFLVNGCLIVSGVGMGLTGLGIIFQSGSYYTLIQQASDKEKRDTITEQTRPARVLARPAPAPAPLPQPTPTVAPSRNRAAPPVPQEPASAWDFDEQTDEISGGIIQTASTTSIDPVFLRAPYDGKQYGYLELIKHPRFGRQVHLSVPRGMFVFTGATKISVRFGNYAPTKFSVKQPTDMSYNTLIVTDFGRFLEGVRAVDHIWIEAEMYQDGKQVFEFDVHDAGGYAQ